MGRPTTYAERETEIHRRLEQAKFTRYMRGWDDSLCHVHRNPYNRVDYRNDYERGHKACTDGKPLPKWYADWRMRARKLA